LLLGIPQISVNSRFRAMKILSQARKGLIDE